MADGAIEFDFAVEGATDPWRVARIEGHEGISRLFHFRVTLASTDAALAFDGLVGQTCLLTIRNDASTRYIHGIVARFEQHEEGRSVTTYLATVARGRGACSTGTTPDLPGGDGAGDHRQGAPRGGPVLRRFPHLDGDDPRSAGVQRAVRRDGLGVHQPPDGRDRHVLLLRARGRQPRARLRRRAVRPRAHRRIERRAVPGRRRGAHREGGPLSLLHGRGGPARQGHRPRLQLPEGQPEPRGGGGGRPRHRSRGVRVCHRDDLPEEGASSRSSGSSSSSSCAARRRGQGACSGSCPGPPSRSRTTAARASAVDT